MALESRNKQLWLGGILVMLLVVAFLLTWWNRFLGASSNGWHFYYGQQILAGRIPYRDFYMYVPPLHPLTFAALIALFGPKLIAGRVLAVLSRTILAGVLYFWLARRFRPSHAFLGSLTATIVFCADTADALSLHNQDSIFWGIVAGFFGSVLISRRARTNCWIWAGLSGFAAGLCFLTKQTTGIGVSIIIPLVLGFVVKRLEFGASMRTVLGAFCTGFIAPVLALSTWLWKSHAFGPYIDQVFVNGLSSKGPVYAVLARPILVTFGGLWYTSCALVAVALLIVYRRVRMRANEENLPSNNTSIFLSFAVGSVALTIGVTLGLHLNINYLVARSPQYIAVYAALLMSCALFLRCTWSYLRGQVGNEDAAHSWLISGVSAAIAYMLSLSWPVHESMAMPSLGLTVCLALNDLAKTPIHKRRFWQLSAYGFSTLMIAVLIVDAVWLKLEEPFGWEGWREPPVRYAITEPRSPFLKGFKLAPATAAFVDRVTELIDCNSGPNDSVFVFPYFPVFYVLSDRKPPTFASVHWFDVTPDYVARRDASLLLKARPAVIVSVELSEAAVENQEISFRGGAQSGQRELISAIHDLAKSYRLADTLFTPGGEYPVKVYVRQDHSQPKHQ
jgi:hypothetical protein